MSTSLTKVLLPDRSAYMSHVFPNPVQSTVDEAAETSPGAETASCFRSGLSFMGKAEDT